MLSEEEGGPPLTFEKAGTNGGADDKAVRGQGNRRGIRQLPEKH